MQKFDPDGDFCEMGVLFCKKYGISNYSCLFFSNWLLTFHCPMDYFKNNAGIIYKEAHIWAIAANQNILVQALL